MSHKQNPAGSEDNRQVKHQEHCMFFSKIRFRCEETYFHLSGELASFHSKNALDNSAKFSSQ